MKDIYLEYLNNTRDKKRLSYEEVRSRLGNIKAVSTLQRIFTGQTEPTVEDFELIVEKGLGEDLRDVYALIGAREFTDSAIIDYKGAKELLADFAAEKEQIRKSYEERIATSRELRAAQQEAFQEAIQALEAKYERGTKYLKGRIDECERDLEAQTRRAVAAEARVDAMKEEMADIKREHDRHCREVHRRYRGLSWVMVGVVLVTQIIRWYLPPHWA